MKLDRYDVAEGDTLFVFNGGPLDKQGWLIDSENAPSQIVADGHRYDLVIHTFEDEPFDFDYVYMGKIGVEPRG